MEVTTFIAETAAQALEKIQTQLGPEAVVVSVRRLPANGLSRLWKSHGGIEVVAGRPEGESRGGEEPRDSIMPRHLPPITPDIAEFSTTGGPHEGLAASDTLSAGKLLAALGILPRFSHELLAALEIPSGVPGSRTLADEMAMLQQLLLQRWRTPKPATQEGRPHVFLGPPGTGKTTVLCKWLTQTVLVEGQPAQVWRLDSQVSNTAEFLSVYTEILGVPLARVWPETGKEETRLERHWSEDSEMHFVDLPGFSPQDLPALKAFRQIVEHLGNPHLHLVLNAAYSTPLILSQIQAFNTLPIEDLVFTHLDEEKQWGKLWNVVLGTNYTIRFLSAGQNIPGKFLRATPEQILPGQNRLEMA